MDSKHAEVIALLFCMSIPIALGAIGTILYFLKELYFRAKFLDALDRGELMKIVKNSSNLMGVSSFDLADYYHVNRMWLLMQARIAGFKVTHYDNVWYDFNKK